MSEPAPTIWRCPLTHPRLTGKTCRGVLHFGPKPDDGQPKKCPRCQVKIPQALWVSE